MIASKGLAYPGASFLTRIWLEYGFLLTAMEAWKSLPSSERSRLLLENPWELCQWVTQIEGGDVRGFRHMFLYFCYPNSFERICSRNHKRKIYEAFSDKMEANQDTYRVNRSPCGLDKSILEIRQVLQAEYNTLELDFYRPPLRELWQTNSEPSSKRIWVEKKPATISAGDIQANSTNSDQPATFNAADGTWNQRAGVEERVRKKLELSIPNEAMRRAALDFLALAIENADEEREQRVVRTRDRARASAHDGPSACMRGRAVENAGQRHRTDR